MNGIVGEIVNFVFNDEKQFKTIYANIVGKFQSIGKVKMNLNLNLTDDEINGFEDLELREIFLK